MATLIAIAASSPAQAQPAAPLANGDFARGSAGWQITGDALVRSGMLTLTTAASSADGDAAFNLSGRPAAPIDTVEAAAGLAHGALDGADAPAYEGSMARQTFSVRAGQTLRLDWLVVSRDARFVDRAFVVVNGEIDMLATAGSAASTGAIPQPGVSARPGLRTWMRTFAKAQRVSLVLGIVDNGDHAGVSSLRVQGVRVDSGNPGRSGAR